jgi:hypothetical protein
MPGQNAIAASWMCHLTGHLRQDNPPRTAG